MTRNEAPSSQPSGCRGRRRTGRVVEAVYGDPVESARGGSWARLCSLPWAVVAALMAVGSLAGTALAAWTGRGGDLLAGFFGLGFTAGFAAWLLARLGAATPTRRALLVVALVVSWLLLTVTPLAAELSLDPACASGLRAATDLAG